MIRTGLRQLQRTASGFQMLTAAGQVFMITPTMRKACVINFWRRSLSASSSSISSSSSTYVNESERVFEMKRRRKTILVSYGGLQAAYIKNRGLVVESYQMVEESDHVFFPWDDLLREYVKKKRMVEASQIFDIMPERSTVSWHVLILGYIKLGRLREAKKIFESSPKTGTVWESMICGFARHGMPNLARRIFNRRPGKDMLTRQMLIAGHYIGDTGHYLGSMDLDLYGLTFTNKKLFLQEKEEREMAMDKHTATWNLLIEGNLFVGLYDGAREIFEEMDTDYSNVKRNVMSWNLMIAAHNQRWLLSEPLPKMPTKLRNSHSWNLMITARAMCGEHYKEIKDKLLEDALTIFHLHTPENQRNTASWNALIYLFVKREKLNEARFYFDNMPERNPHSWGLMMAGYLHAEMVDEAKNIFFDKNIRVCDDLHSWVLILGWFVRKKKMFDEARRFVVNNVPKTSLSFYSIACACIKHGFREESKLVLESMQATMHTNLNIHETITFVEEKLKEKCGPLMTIHESMIKMVAEIQKLEAAKNFSDPYYQAYASKVKEESGPMFKYEPHSFSHTFLQILDSVIDANGDCSQIFLKGSCDCCGLLQI